MRARLLKRIDENQTENKDDAFNALALEIYRYQFDHNIPYRNFSLLQKKTPQKVICWQEIPALPVTAFQSLPVICRPIEQAKQIFYSSGTTRGIGRGIGAGGKKRSAHALFDESIARAAILSHFKKKMLPDDARLRFCILTPSPEEAPHSSLSYMMETVRAAFGTSDSRYYIHQGRLLADQLAYDLSEAQTPVALLGTSFAFVHLIDFLVERSDPITLLPGSRVMDTGGFKGQSRTVSAHWLYAMIERLLSISVDYCVNEYGMAEITSQFYDKTAGMARARVHAAPPQMRWQILSPETLQIVGDGETGLIAIYDLANIDSVMAILTEDLGRAVHGGIEIIGRATGAAVKGCSVDLDTLLAPAPPSID
ncbi:MAG: long-chain fatty acid--CoA ligase [Nitrospirota bacterium]